MKLIKLLKKYINLYISSSVPKTNKLLIFGSWLGEKYADNPRYLFEYVIKNRPDLKAIWITSNQDVFKELQKKQYLVMMAEAPETRKIVKKAKYIFTATGIFDIGEQNANFVGGAYLINLWHGIPLKKIMYDDKHSALHKRSKLVTWVEKIPLRNYFVISTSTAITQIYQSAFRVKKSNILELGQPRNDYFYDKSNPVSSLIQELKSKNIILYMPTHRNEGKKQIDLDKLMDLEHLNNWCEETKSIFVIKKHFYHSKEKTIDKKYSSIIDVTNEKVYVQELLKCSNVLITDYSSCYIDYLLLNRPIIFFNYDYDDYLRVDRSLYFPYENVTPGEKCQNFDELLVTLQNLYVGKDDYREERENIKTFFYSSETQKSVSEKIINHVLNL
ncbi:TPA: CDP-glycerol glycerophosphotransferase family protein [Streptococcus pneumoniae]|nr:CDP-glycerol glycerophosphotransferase family protein [Streptococcus pneumoniae]